MKRDDIRLHQEFIEFDSLRAVALSLLRADQIGVEGVGFEASQQAGEGGADASCTDDADGFSKEFVGVVTVDFRSHPGHRHECPLCAIGRCRWHANINVIANSATGMAFAPPLLDDRDAEFTCDP